MLKNEDKEGCFVVRNSSTPGLYTLSLYTKLPHPQVSIFSSKLSCITFISERKFCTYKIHSNIIRRFQVKHYHIKQNPQGGFFLSEKHCCASIPELIEYHSYNGMFICYILIITTNGNRWCVTNAFYDTDLKIYQFQLED